MQRRILVVEDNQDLASLLTLHLTDQSWQVTVAHDGVSGYKKAAKEGFDLIILDIMLPGMDGMELLKSLRSQGGLTPVLMLTAKDTEIDRVLGLELGADDYLTKPFSIRELVARIKALFRRMENLATLARPPRPLVSGSLVIDPDRRSAQLGGRPLDLTAKEYDLLVFFASNPGRVFTRAQLLDKVWGYGHEGYAHTVNSSINRIRAKIEPDPANPRFILTVWGVGYKFREAENA